MKLVAIGHLGEKSVYIGLKRDEAINRYDKENPSYTVSKNSLSVKEMEVDGKFYVYDIWTEELS